MYPGDGDAVSMGRAFRLTALRGEDCESHHFHKSLGHIMFRFIRTMQIQRGQTSGASLMG